MNNKKYQVSLIVPALNEVENLERSVLDILSALKKHQIMGEIVLIDDGSTDGTAELANKLGADHSNVLVLHNKENQGIGFSFWEGSKLASGDVIVMMPGDGENDPIEILRYLPLMTEVDVVIPFVYNIENRSFYRRMLSKVYKAIINLSFGMLLNYMNGTVMYRRSVLLSLSLQSSGFFYQTELLIKAIRNGFLYAEVPYAIKFRTKGDSKAMRFYALFRLIRDYIHALLSVYVEGDVEDLSYPVDSATYRQKSKSLP